MDFDATDDQVTTHIMPYFRAVRDSLGGGYRVGIYASRNICTRVIEAGYAGTAFVSDMSTGFSGNLGFSIPKDWTYDQFTEISGYRGKWDLDKVAYSNAWPAVSYVSPQTVEDPNPNTATDYEKLSPIDLIWHLEKRFDELRKDNKVGRDYISTSHGDVVTVEVSTWRAILNYLSKEYLAEGGSGSGSTFQWTVAAEPWRGADASVLENDPIAKKIIAAWQRWCGDRKQHLIDVAGGEVDMPHMAVTTLGYLNTNVVPDRWTGWAGDLATAMGELQKLKNWNKDRQVNLDRAARGLVGQKDDYLSDPGLSGYTLYKDGDHIRNTCNYADMCSDGDAIVFARELPKQNEHTHILSNFLGSYYTDKARLANRFKEIAWSVGAKQEGNAATEFEDNTTWSEAIFRDLLASEAPDSDVITACCKALASFIFSR